MENRPLRAEGEVARSRTEVRAPDLFYLPPVTRGKFFYPVAKAIRPADSGHLSPALIHAQVEVS